MGVFVNSGIGAQVLAMPEATFGVSPNFATASPLEFNTEGLKGKKNVVQGKGIHAGGLHYRGARRVVTYYEAAGPLNIDLPTRYINRLIMQMLGSKNIPSAALLQDGVTGAFNAIHQPGSLLGTSMAIQKGVPAVDSAAAPLPFTYTGGKMTDWTLQVQKGAIATLATNWDFRNELGGTTTPIDPLNGSVPSLGNFAEAANNNVFHFREATLYTGGTIGVSTFGSALASPPAVPASTVPANSTYPYLTAVTISGGTLTKVFVNGVQVGTTAGTYAVPQNGQIAITYSVAPTWTWFAGITTVTSPVVAGNVQSAEVKYSFKLDNSRIFLGSQGFKAEQIENDYRDIGGQFTIEFLNSQALYNAYVTDTPTSLQLTFDAGIIGSGTDHSILTILIPQIFLEGDPPAVGGPGIVTQNIPFTGLDDGTNAPIQITYGTLDSV